MKAGARAQDAETAIANGGGSLHRSIDALRTHVVRVRADRVDAAISALSNNPHVFSIELDQGRKISSAPNDTAYGFQWALPKIGWDQVFGVVNIAGSATIAVLDTGVQSSDATLVPGWSAFGTDPTEDLHGHGTMVASIAAATSDNSLGIAGVGFSGVSIMPVQVIAADGTGQDSDIVAGLTWAADNGANVAIMAFSDPGYSQTLQDAVNYALSKGVVVVAAAGNDASTSPTYPAGDVNVVGVGATDQNDAMWSGSNISPAVYITAPGVDIAAESPSGSVTSMTGTSASAAIIGGAAALLKAADPQATPGVIIGRLARNADAGGMANGRINLARALSDTSTTEVMPNGASGGGPIVGPYTVAANRKITVTLGGIQQGVVTSNPSGITCGSGNNCNANFNTTIPVTLTAAPFSGATFTGWTGACAGAGTNTTCVLPATSSDQATTANFGGQYLSTTTVTCPTSTVYTATARTPCTAAWSSPQPASGTLTPSYTNNLNVGTATASASFAGNTNNTPSSGSKTFQITKAPLTVTFTIAPKVYDGTTSAVVNGCTLSGVIASDSANVSCVFSGANATLSTASAGSATATGTGFTLSGSAASNYNITTINTLNTTIAQKPVTVNFTAADKTFDGTTTANITGSSLSGVVIGDVVNVNSGSGTANFSDASIGVGKTVSANTSIFSLTGPKSGNYFVGTVNNTTATIAAASLMIAFTAADKTYDQTTAASITGCTLTGRVSGDTTTACTGGSATFADKNAGTGKTVTGTGFALSGPNAGNYIISNTSPTTTATINPKSLSVTATGVNRVYDGTTNATVTVSDDRLSGDIFTVNRSASFLDANAGVAKTVNVSGISLSGSDAGNYTPNATTSTTANITSASLTATITASDKAYDGTTAALITNCSLATIVPGDVVSCVTTTPVFSDKNAGTGKTVTASISLSGASAGNYTVNATAQATADITARPLSISATGINKTYNGTTGASVTLSDDRVAGDVLTAIYASALFNDKNVGTGKTVSVSGISISGTDANNYSFNATTSTTADITARSLTVSATGINKTFDGNTDATVTLGDNRVAGDVLITSYSSASFADHNVGSGKQVSVSGISISGADATNYTFNSTALTTADITARALTISATGVNKIYDGTMAASVTLSDDRVAGTDVTAGYTSALFADKHVGSGKSVEVSGISITGPDAGNYSANETASTSADITAKELTIGATGVNKTYDGNTVASVTLSDDRVAGDVFTSAYSSASFADKNVGTGKGVSVAGISIVGADAGNYTFNTSASTTADITLRSLAVTATGVGKVYDGTTSATVTLSDDRIAGDNLTSSYASASFADQNAGTAKTISVSGILITGDDAGNYSANTSTQTTADITKATLSINADAKSKTYGEADPAFTWTYSGYVLTDSPAAVELTISGAAACSRDAGENAGQYTISCAPGSLSATNYSFAQGSTATLTIDKATLMVKAVAASKSVGASDPAFTWTYNGFVGANNASNSNITGSASCSRTSGEAWAGNPYTITCAPGSLSAPNYDFATGSTAAFTINDVAGPTITLNAPTNGAVYALNQSVLASYSCQDETNGSGVESCVGTTSNGAPIATNSVGTKTFTVTAKDNAGNTTTLTHTYQVQYVFTGFGQPVNMNAVNVANSGRAIPLKFTVKDSAGVGVTSLPLFTIYQVIYQCGNIANLLAQDLSVYATGASGLQNLGGGNWQFNWNTEKNYKGSCRQIQVNAGDGVIHTADFKFE